MDYVELYCKDYLQAVYRFCRKRTSSEQEAEELASTINLEIIAGIKKRQPEHFEAWMWKVAKNCYSKWAKQKHIQITHFTKEELNLQEMETIALASPEEYYVQNETLGLLRRELAFIKKEYRRILTFYYKDQKKIREIAERLEMPEGTIKQRLYSAKHLLRKSIESKREFGVRSWAPEDMRYLTNDCYPHGIMLEKLRRKIITNLFLEADNHPMTREEFANALGIAGPYLEDETGLLEYGQLLKKIDRTHYITNFFIYSRECQRKIYELLRSAMDQISPLLMELLDQSMSDIRPLFQNAGDLQQLRWFLLPTLCDLLRLEVKEQQQSGFTRTDGGFWALAGFADHADLPEEVISNYTLCMPNQTEHAEGYLMGYSLSDLLLNLRKNIPDARLPGTFLFYDCYTLKSPMEEKHRDVKPVPLYLLTELLTNHKTLDQLSQTESVLWEYELNHTFVTSENGILTPVMLTITMESMAKLTQSLRSTPTYQELKQLTEQLSLQIRKHLHTIHNPVLINNLPYYQCLPLNYMRMIAINDAVKHNWLVLPQNFCDKQYGACFFLPIYDMGI